MQKTVSPIQIQNTPCVGKVPPAALNTDPTQLNRPTPADFGTARTQKWHLQPPHQRPAAMVLGGCWQPKGGAWRPPNNPRGHRGHPGRLGGRGGGIRQPLGGRKALFRRFCWPTASVLPRRTRRSRLCKNHSRYQQTDFGSNIVYTAGRLR